MFRNQPHFSRRFRSRALVLGLTSLSLLSACLNQPEDKGGPGEENWLGVKADAKAAGLALAASFSVGNQGNPGLNNPADAGWVNEVLGSSSALAKQASLTQTAAAKAALAKSGRLSGDTLTATLDSVAMVVHITHSYSLLGVAIVETADARWDEKATDDIEGNEHVLRFSQTRTHVLGKVEQAVFEDADGDGLVNAVSPTSKVKVVFTKQEEGLTEQAVAVVECGPDVDFDSEDDNRVYQADWKRMRGAALMAEASFSDGDGDGIVVDHADTSVVLVQLHEIQPPERPWVAEAKAHAKVRLFGKENGVNKGDEPVTFAFTETLRSGRVNTLSLKNSLGGEDMIPDDTLWVTLKTQAKSDDDTLQSLVLDFVMTPGPDLSTDTDDSLYAMHIHSVKKLGFEREAEFHFWSDAPIPKGEEPEAGRFSGKATYANGQTASLEGTFSPQGFHAEYTDSEGHAAQVGYTLSGEMLP